MRSKPAISLCALSLVLASCGGQAKEEQLPAGEAVTASPTAAAGVSPEELDTRQVVSQLGIAARNLENAETLEGARDALGTIEEQLSVAKEDLPENLAAEFEAELETAREAVAADNLAVAKAAGQKMINSVLLSENVQDPTLIRPEGEQPAPVTTD